MPNRFFHVSLYFIHANRTNTFKNIMVHKVILSAFYKAFKQGQRAGKSELKRYIQNWTVPSQNSIRCFAGPWD